jgi:hypothetical protein
MTIYKWESKKNYLHPIKKAKGKLVLFETGVYGFIVQNGLQKSLSHFPQEIAKAIHKKELEKKNNARD